MGTKDARNLDLDQQVNFLKKIAFFDDFDDHELKQFLNVSKWMIVSKDTLLIEENSMGRGFYILVQGEVSVFKTIDGGAGKLELTTLKTGDCFGEMSLVTEIKRTAGVETTKNSFILMVEPDIINTSNVFLQLKFYKRFCEILVSRLIMANERMVTQAGEPVKVSSPDRERAKEKVKALDDRRDELFVKPKAEGPGKNVAEGGRLGSLPPMPVRKPRVSPASIRRKIEPEYYLHVNPSVAERLSSFLVGEVEDTRRFSELILLDPVLSSVVLQTANSSFFRRAVTVASVPHAMIAVGIKHIQTVISETIEKSREITVFSGDGRLTAALWEHSVAVGRIAAMLKDAIRLNISGDIYLAGLLHDFGMFALDRMEPRFYPQLLNPDHIFHDLNESEKEYIGIDHGLAGCWIAQKMGLPGAYADVMRFHHFPENTKDNFLSVALVHIADVMATSRKVCVGNQKDASEDLIRSFAWVLIQEQHKVFMEVNLNEFISSFAEEVNKAWDSITGDVLI
ncbi:MAG: HDOD domain-containing protein [Proteobacteria bacterium]|nr:HDOD domain-containing protein [Pseudomonadota bacterium]MBU1708604.1 HDOD domain-containing protein [Pseudomonadota bacterium]